MATHRSAEKRARQSLKRRARNRQAKSQVRSLTKSLRVAIAGGDGEGAQQKLRSAERGLGPLPDFEVASDATQTRQRDLQRRLLRGAHQGTGKTSDRNAALNRGEVGQVERRELDIVGDQVAVYGMQPGGL